MTPSIPPFSSGTNRPAALLAALTIAVFGLPGAGPGTARAAQPEAVAVAEFDNLDTAGETAARTAAHAARVAGFDDLVGAAFDRTTGLRTVPMTCPAGACSASATPPAVLIARARAAGARILVYGRIQKMSTLVQIGKVQAVDLASERLLIDRNFTFRGDDDRAFEKAADFMARQIAAAAH